jgi:hypothetical protein
VIYDRWVLPAALAAVTWSGACAWAYALAVTHRWRFLIPAAALAMLAFTYMAELSGRDPVVTLRTVRTIAVPFFAIVGVLVPLEWVGYRRRLSRLRRLRDGFRAGGD